MSAMTSQISGVSIFAQPFVQAQVKDNIKLRLTGLCEGNPPVIWWRHDVLIKFP